MNEQLLKRVDVVGKPHGEKAGQHRWQCLVRQSARAAATLRAGLVGLSLDRLSVVVILDQNFEYGPAGALLGTDLCRAMREAHAFRGVVAIMSANDDTESASLYRRAGADLACSKTLDQLAGLRRQLARVHYKRTAATAAAWTSEARLLCSSVDPH